MLNRIYIKDLKTHIGGVVSVSGFVNSLRDQGGIKFAVIRDITGFIQVVFLKSNKETFDKFGDISLESVVQITGIVKEEKQAPGGYEIAAEDLVILSKADPNLPIPVVFEKGGEETDQTLRFDYRWIDLRKEDRSIIFKVWTELEKGFRQYVFENNYIQIYTPSIMGMASETGADVFEVSYFDRKAYLAQSPQFYKQMAMASGLEKVFVVGPVFRAEPSYTTRHVTEFTGWDFEISYIKDHYDVMAEEEKMIETGFMRLKEVLNLNIEIPTTPFPRLTMKEAKELLSDAGVPGDRPYDFSPEEERELSKIIKETKNHDFLFVSDYPIEIRPFYHMRHEDNPQLTKSFDLFYKGIEITTGAQREHRYDILSQQALEKGMSLEELKDYLDFFKYGCPPHGGAGIGPARIIMKILDLPSIKEAIFLPRDVKRLTP